MPQKMGKLFFQNLLTKSFYGGILFKSIYRGVEQLAARWAHNPKVGSSSLPPATN